MAKSVLNPRRYPRAALRTRPADGMLIPSERKEKGTLPPSYVKRTLTNLEPSSGDRVSLWLTLLFPLSWNPTILEEFCVPQVPIKNKFLATVAFKKIRTIVTCTMHECIYRHQLEIACLWLCFPMFSLSICLHGSCVDTRPRSKHDGGEASQVAATQQPVECPAGNSEKILCPLACFFGVGSTNWNINTSSRFNDGMMIG